MHLTRIPHLLYGGDYNPEQWPRSVWLEDVRLMKEAKVNLVTLAVFGWARLQPQEEVFDFAWLDEVLDLLAANGIYADLATATASPPAWLARKHPEILPVKEDGTVLHFGSRQSYTPNSPVFREYAARLVRALALRYRAHPALALWHISNEYGCHFQGSHGEADVTAFRAWLKERYGDLETLNEAWGTAFWSQRYGQWEEILTPVQTPSYGNPAQLLDFTRFFAEAWRQCYQSEWQILHELSPDIPVTTNFMGASMALNQHDWKDDVSFASTDLYPDPDPLLGEPEAMGYPLDITRGVKAERPFALMEQVTTQVNWRTMNRLKRPGQIRLWSLQSVARGADAVLFFQWRQSRAGAEKYHAAMLPHVAPASSRIFAEVQQLGDDLTKLDSVCGTQVEAQTAVLLSWPSAWALHLPAKPRTFDQTALIRDYWLPLYRNNIVTDVLPPSANLSAYKVVCAPTLYLLSADEAANLRDYVAQGGTLVVSFFSGIVNEYEQIHTGGYPALLREVLGLWVEEWEPYRDNESNSLRLQDGRSVPCGYFNELLHLDGAEALAVFEHDFFQGRPAITRHRYGKGTAYYVATRPDPAWMQEWLRTITLEAQVEPSLVTPQGVEAVVRSNAQARFLFLLNHNTTPVRVDLGNWKGQDLLTGRSAAHTVDMAPLDAVILMRARAAHDTP